MASAEVRLQKYLSAAGIASRRQAETLIVAGRVTVNGVPATELGTKVDPKRDKVDVDGVQIRVKAFVYLLMNKPRGSVCSERDPEGRPRVHDLLPKGLPRLFTVGRLDWDTEGLLLFTNDGDLAKALTDPQKAVPRVYQVKIQGDADPNIVRRFIEGVRLETGFRTASAPTELIKRTDTNAWYEVVLAEGKNRQIRKMVEACGRRVLKLRRVAYGPVHLGTLPVEKCRPLTEEEIYGLHSAVGLRSARNEGDASVEAIFGSPAKKASTRKPAALDGAPRSASSDDEAERPRPRRAPARGRTLDAPPTTRRTPDRGKNLDAPPSTRRAPARVKDEAAPPKARRAPVRTTDDAAPRKKNQRSQGRPKNVDAPPPVRRAPARDGAAAPASEGRTRTGARARYTENKVAPSRNRGPGSSDSGGKTGRSSRGSRGAPTKRR